MTDKTSPKPRHPKCGIVHAAYSMSCGDCGVEQPFGRVSRARAVRAAMFLGWARLQHPWWRCPSCAMRFQEEMGWLTDPAHQPPHGLSFGGIP